MPPLPSNDRLAGFAKGRVAPHFAVERFPSVAERLRVRPFMPKVSAPPSCRMQKKEAAAGGGVAIKVAGAAVAVDVRWRPLHSSFLSLGHTQKKMIVLTGFRRHCHCENRV